MADIDRLRQENPLHIVAADFGVRLEKDGHEFIACCPFHQEDTPSFTIFPGKDGVQRFHCFGCGEKGDVLDFVQKLKGVDLKEAIRVLGGEVRRENVQPRRIAEPVDIYAGIVPLAPAGEIKAGRRVKLWNPKRDKFGTITPSMAFPYRAADGSLIGYVLRHDLQDGGKETPMVMWCRLPDGSTEWCRYPFPKPRPLFGLDRLGSGKQVIISEGEKCATVGAAITGRLFMSWAGGTYGIHHADWSPLAGRSVVIWPDADGPGLETAKKIAAILHGLGCTVKIMDVSDKPKGWDVADAADQGWSRDEIDAFMRARVRPWEPDGGDHPPEPPAPPPAPAPEADEAIPEPPPRDYDAGDWVPDPYGDLGEVEMDKSGELIEFDKSNRRAVPASGRSKPGIPYRAWGGDADLMREWAFLSSEGVFCHVHTGDRMARGPFDLVMVNDTPMIETIDGKGETKNVRFPPSKTLIDFCDGLVASRTMYRPDVDAMTVWVDGVLHLNSYLPASVPVADPDWQSHDAWRAARDHIHNILPDGADTIIKWLAHNVQHPGKKILWCPILVGQQGDGKTTIGSILQQAMGRRNVVAVGPEELFSDFTSWAEGAAVRVLEELHQDGVNRSSVVEKLKAPITNSEVPVVGKGEKGRSVVNVTNYMGLTNNMDGLRIPEGDRRFGVWKTRFKDRPQVLRELTKEYWRRLHDAIGKHPEVLRGWLLSVDLSDFDRFDAPSMTDAKIAMIEASRSPLSADIREAIALGGLGVGRDVLVTDMLNDLVKAMGGRSASTTTMSSIMREMGWARLDKSVKWNGKPRRVYYLPGPWCEGLEGADLATVLRERLQDTELDRPEIDDRQGVLDPANW
jgi:hypothetical protein